MSIECREKIPIWNSTREMSINSLRKMSIWCRGKKPIECIVHIICISFGLRGHYLFVWIRNFWTKNAGRYTTLCFLPIWVTVLKNEKPEMSGFRGRKALAGTRGSAEKENWHYKSEKKDLSWKIRMIITVCFTFSNLFKMLKNQNVRFFEITKTWISGNCLKAVIHSF